MSVTGSSLCSESSLGTAASGWGLGDPGMGLTGVHLRVLGGRPVWPLAFHELAAASDRRVHVEQRMAGVDFVPDRLGPRTAGALFLERVLRGEAVDWATRDVPPGEADCVLAALGLLHVRVKCVIPEEYGGFYEPEVLWWGVDETLAELFARHPSKGRFEGNPKKRFRAVVDGVAYGPNRTPGAIGLYGGRYTVEFRPGADYEARSQENDLLEVEWMGGDSEMTEEEYEAALYRGSELRPARGGRYFEPRVVGTGYTRGEVRMG